MEQVDMLKDILQYRIANQIFYNENIILIRNPEVRQIFTQLRDDEMRAIAKLQQKIERIESPAGIVAKIFPTRPAF
jgi:rubrerythrin